MPTSALAGCCQTDGVSAVTVAVPARCPSASKTRTSTTLPASASVTERFVRYPVDVSADWLTQIACPVSPAPRRSVSGTGRRPRPYAPSGAATFCVERLARSASADETVIVPAAPSARPNSVFSAEGILRLSPAASVRVTGAGAGFPAIGTRPIVTVVPALPAFVRSSVDEKRAPARPETSAAPGR